MTLREAIEKVLIEHGGVLTTEEVCEQIRTKNLFTKKNGTFPDRSYVLFGIKNYLDDFEVTIGLKT